MKGLYRSFAGGEITPEMFGRLDLGKYQTGLQKALNFTTLPHGPAARRPGTRFIREVANSAYPARLIPFVFSATQAVIIELGHLTARFHSAAGTTLSPDVRSFTYTSGSPADPVIFTFATPFPLGSTVYLTGMTGSAAALANVPLTTAKNGTSLNNPFLKFASGAFVTGADLPNASGALTASAYIGGGAYTLATPWAAADLATLTFAQNADVLTVVSPLYAAREFRRLAADNWQLSTVTFVPTLAAPSAPSATATATTPTTPTVQSYRITSIGSDGITESAATATVTATNNLTIAGNFNTIAWTAAAGAVRYYVYKLRGGSFGYIGQTTGTSLLDENILADTTTTPPESTITLNTATSQYPATVTYFEQRRWFAGTVQQPQNVWATRNATEANLTSSTPSRDDDALAFRIAAQQQNAIRHLVPLIDLVALTAGGEFRIFADGGAAITPGTLSIKPQSYSGAAPIQPALTSESCLYVQSQGSRIRELSYESSGLGRYKSTDVSLFAPHLFNGKQMKELAYVRSPDQTLWVVRTDGILLGMTYVPDQQVFGWHQHSTDGTFESAAAIPENGEDALYVCVRRTIGGVAKRYVERLASRLFTAAANAWYVDCGISYTGDPQVRFSGLDHLEGKAVQVLADGAVVSGRTVVAGVLTPDLDVAASVVTVGLAYNSDLQTLPAVLDQTQANGQGTMKNASKVFLRVTQSSMVKAGPTFDKLTEYPARAVNDPYGSPPALRTGELSLAISPSWNTDGAVCVRQDQPLPLTVLSLTIDESVGG